MINKVGLLRALAFVMLFAATMRAQADGIDGEGIDSQLYWPSPGPSNFPSVLSSDVVGHANVTFSGMFNYYRKPLGVKSLDSGETDWLVENAFVADFLWAFGIIDIFQVGLVLPVVLDQDGSGATPLMPQGADRDKYTLAGSALRDLRFNVKARFLGGEAEIPDQRDFGLALELGVAVPSGDELSFAGDEGVVFFPTAILDFHRCMFSAAVNLGARFRFSESGTIVGLRPGHQGTASIGVTGHFLKRRLLTSIEGAGFAEFDGFDRMTLEYRGGIGYIPDEGKAVTIWVSAGSSTGTGDLLGAPEVRVLFGLTYAPGNEEEDCCGL